MEIHPTGSKKAKRIDADDAEEECEGNGIRCDSSWLQASCCLEQPGETLGHEDEQHKAVCKMVRAMNGASIEVLKKTFDMMMMMNYIQDTPVEGHTETPQTLLTRLEENMKLFESAVKAWQYAKSSVRGSGDEGSTCASLTKE